MSLLSLRKIAIFGEREATTGNACAVRRLDPQRTQRITGSAFRVSFHLDWQIDNGIFNRPILTSTQILVHKDGGGGGAKNKDFGASQKDLTRVQIRLRRKLLRGSTSISFMKFYSLQR